MFNFLGCLSNDVLCFFFKCNFIATKKNRSIKCLLFYWFSFKFLQSNGLSRFRDRNNLFIPLLMKTILNLRNQQSVGILNVTITKRLRYHSPLRCGLPVLSYASAEQPLVGRVLVLFRTRLLFLYRLVSHLLLKRI